ncbi:MAG: winged helix-turn-helix domain-containing protein [Thermoguttaceae bacterium]|jgi:restriction system protein|nr:winged helix-turn-helix domain-containing protein [Thermoguttaceae bacterium]
MAIPDFQSVMLPLLRFCGDGHEHTNQEALDAIALEFGLTEEEQKELLPSGQQSVINNRVAWAKAHMKMARLLEHTRRGVFRITPRGQEILAQTPPLINLSSKKIVSASTLSTFKRRSGRTPFHAQKYRSPQGRCKGSERERASSSRHLDSVMGLLSLRKTSTTRSSSSMDSNWHNI